MASTQPGVICGLTNGSELMEKTQASEGERWMGREARASSRVVMGGPTKEMAGLKLKKVEGGGRYLGLEQPEERKQPALRPGCVRQVV